MTASEVSLRVQPSRNRLTVRAGTDAEGRTAIEILGPREYALAPWQAIELANALVDTAERIEQEARGE